MDILETRPYMMYGIWNAGNDLHIHFTVAGATYLPFRFLLIPVNGDQKVFPAEDKV